MYYYQQDEVWSKVGKGAPCQTYEQTSNHLHTIFYVPGLQYPFFHEAHCTCDHGKFATYALTFPRLQVGRKSIICQGIPGRHPPFLIYRNFFSLCLPPFLVPLSIFFARKICLPESLFLDKKSNQSLFLDKNSNQIDSLILNSFNT